MSATVEQMAVDPREEKNFKPMISDQPEASRPMADQNGASANRAEAAKVATAADAVLDFPGTTITRYEAYVDHNHTPTDILHPLYWGPHHDRLKAGDYIDVETNDCSWLARIRVMEVDAMAGTVVVAPVGDLSVFQRPPVPEGFVIQFVTRTAGFRVVRAGDGGKLMKGGFRSFHGAHSWLTGQR